MSQSGQRRAASSLPSRTSLWCLRRSVSSARCTLSICCCRSLRNSASFSRSIRTLFFRSSSRSVMDWIGTARADSDRSHTGSAGVSAGAQRIGGYHAPPGPSHSAANHANTRGRTRVPPDTKLSACATKDTHDRPPPFPARRRIAPTHRAEAGCSARGTPRPSGAAGQRCPWLTLGARRGGRARGADEARHGAQRRARASRYAAMGALQ